MASGGADVGVADSTVSATNGGAGEVMADRAWCATRPRARLSAHERVSGIGYRASCSHAWRCRPLGLIEHARVVEWCEFGELGTMVCAITWVSQCECKREDEGERRGFGSIYRRRRFTTMLIIFLSFTAFIYDVPILAIYHDVNNISTVYRVHL